MPILKSSLALAITFVSLAAWSGSLESKFNNNRVNTSLQDCYHTVASHEAAARKALAKRPGMISFEPQTNYHCNVSPNGQYVYLHGSDERFNLLDHVYFAEYRDGRVCSISVNDAGPLSRRAGIQTSQISCQ
jgi:hypothetical protein